MDWTKQLSTGSLHSFIMVSYETSMIQTTRRENIFESNYERIYQGRACQVLKILYDQPPPHMLFSVENYNVYGPSIIPRKTCVMGQQSPKYSKIM